MYARFVLGRLEAADQQQPECVYCLVDFGSRCLVNFDGSVFFSCFVSAYSFSFCCFILQKLFLFFSESYFVLFTLVTWPFFRQHGRCQAQVWNCCLGKGLILGCFCVCAYLFDVFCFLSLLNRIYSNLDLFICRTRWLKETTQLFNSFLKKPKQLSTEFKKKLTNFIRFDKKQQQQQQQTNK